MYTNLYLKIMIPYVILLLKQLICQYTNGIIHDNDNTFDNNTMCIVHIMSFIVFVNYDDYV